MGRLIVSAQMTVDAVMDHLDQWFTPGDSPDGLAQLRAADAVILGRRTYEGLSEFWPKQDDAWAKLINPLPKHVASRSLTGPLTWNSELLGPDVGGAVAELKKRYAGDLILYGCGELANSLARDGVVDEVRLWLHPVVLGDGVRPFHAGRLPVRMRLLSTTTYDSGVVRLSYQPV